MTTQTFLLPDLGEGLTEAEVVRWLVAVGDVVAVDAPLVEVETAKSLVEVPSPYAGVVAELHGEEGTTIDVGKPLITIGTSTTPAPAVEAYREEEKAGSGNVLIGYGTPAGTGSGRRRRPRQLVGVGSAPAVPAVPDERAVEATAGVAVPAVPSGRVGAAPATAVPAVPAGGAEPAVPANGGVPAVVAGGAVPAVPARRAVPLVISPLVRRLAQDAGVDLHLLDGSGAGGVITRRDVEHAIAAREAGGTNLPSAAPAAGAPAPAATGVPTSGVPALDATPVPASASAPVGAAAPGGVVDSRTGLLELRRERVSGFRRAVAATLSRSRAEIPEATTWVDVDATALIELRESLRTASDSGPGLLALMARFVVAGLQKHPELNGFVDTERDELVQYDGINLGLAAQTARGLVVPAVVGAHALTTRGLDAEIRRLTASARDGRLTTHELSCGSFTLNNYGSFGVDGSAAIINYPQVAILGVGRIIDRPWVVDGELAIRKLTQLSLVFDHRVCDGGTAAAFLRFVADAFENPSSAFADI